MCVSVGAVSLAVFLYAFRLGAFDGISEQSEILFETRDLQLERPWESTYDRDMRRTMHGDLLPPKAYEWGGAA